MSKDKLWIIRAERNPPKLNTNSFQRLPNIDCNILISPHFHETRPKMRSKRAWKVASKFGDLTSYIFPRFFAANSCITWKNQNIDCWPPTFSRDFLRQIHALHGKTKTLTVDSLHFPEIFCGKFMHYMEKPKHWLISRQSFDPLYFREIFCGKIVHYMEKSKDWPFSTAPSKKKI